MKTSRKIVHTEGESNTSAARLAFARRHEDPATADLLRRDADAFLHQSLSSPCVSTIARAEGIWIEDTAGRRYMDFHGNSVHHIGYAHPKLVAAIKEQLDTLSFAPRRFTCEPAVELAETLGRLAPGDLGKVLFTTGGSDAIEVALKVARAATGRFKTVSFWDAFHGAGFGAASVGGEATFRSHIAGPMMTGTEHVAPVRLLPVPVQARGAGCLRARLRRHGRPTCWRRRGTWPPSSPNRCGRRPIRRRRASGRRCGRPATGMARC